MRSTVPALLATILMLGACSGGGESVKLDNDAADAGSGVAEVYDNSGAALPNGGAGMERTDAASTIGETGPSAAPESPAGTTAKPAELTRDQIEAQYSPAYTSCLNGGDAAKGVTSAMADCIGDELQVQDERLNAAYKAAMGKRDAAGQTTLRDEERAWIKARDAKCQALAQGGSIDAIQIPSCVLDETIRRRAVLQPMAG